MKTPKRTPLAFEPGEKVVFLGIDEAAVRAHVELAEMPSSCALEGDGCGRKCGRRRGQSRTSPRRT